MEIRVIEARMKVDRFKVAQVLVEYHGLGLYLDICLYKKEKLWVRMPEIWIGKKTKKRFGFWFDKNRSDAFQEIVLRKVNDMLGLDVERAIQELEQFAANTKKLTGKEKNINLSKHTSEVVNRGGMKAKTPTQKTIPH
jgi:hypothetical protein